MTYNTGRVKIELESKNDPWSPWVLNLQVITQFEVEILTHTTFRYLMAGYGFDTNWNEI